MTSYEFQGTHTVPGSVLQLASKRQITLADLLLYHIIASLARNDPKGCFATNAYLADAIGVEDKRYISRRIQRLCALGVFKVEGSISRDGTEKRYLTLPTEKERPSVPNTPLPNGRSLIGEYP